jgi:asparaginyl-tRNA synthetase
MRSMNQPMKKAGMSVRREAESTMGRGVSSEREVFMASSIPRREKIRALFEADRENPSVLVKGWVRTVRDHKDFIFVEINDGSCLTGIQVVADAGGKAWEVLRGLSTGASASVCGALVPSPAKGQKWELKAESAEKLGDAPEDFPLQKKRHSDEFLRTIAHLRPRTNKYSAVFRVRSKMALSVHEFFGRRGFFYIHTPIITASDCEGAGDLFRVTTLKPNEPPETDFFGRPSYLTVSGQLAAEMFACALSDVYTFGPTFRAENSNTARHAAEFWMVEPESAFSDASDNMALAEDLLRHLITQALSGCNEDMSLFSRFVDTSLIPTLAGIVERPFARISYTGAIEILKKSGVQFQYPPDWGKDLSTEHERYLSETHVKGPVIVYDYPAALKPFYMRLNDDGRTVAAMDVLVPRIGEIIGGSQREERPDILASRIREAGMSEDDYGWYLDSRKFGSVPHAGFGLGFERLIMLVTGISNIRDVTAYPRTPGFIAF